MVVSLLRRFTTNPPKDAKPPIRYFLLEVAAPVGGNAGKNRERTR